MHKFCLVYLFLFSACFGQQCAHHQEKSLYLCDTDICHSVWVTSGLLVGASLQPADRTPPIQSYKYQCRIATVISPDDGHMVARNMQRRERNIRRIMHLVGFICEIIQGCTVKKTYKKQKRTALLWVITQRVVVISYRRFGTIYRSHIQWSRTQK